MANPGLEQFEKSLGIEPFWMVEPINPETSLEDSTMDLPLDMTFVVRRPTLEHVLNTSKSKK